MTAALVPGAQILARVAGWIIVVFIGLLGVLVLWNIYTNRIDLKFLLCEESGKASLSRFQFLVFTFVIRDELRSHHAEDGQHSQYSAGRMGAARCISGGSYVISKGIQKSSTRATVVRNAEGGSPRNDR
jgi:hypothetical protein